MQTASGSVRELHSTNLGAAGQFFVATKGAGGGVLHVQWLHILVLHLFSGQNRSHKSVSQAQKRAAKILRHVESNTRFQRQGPADLQPFIHDEEILTMSYTMSYTTSYAI